MEYIYLLEQNMLMIELKNKPKNVHANKYGIYKQTSSVINDKPSWVNGECAIWFSKTQEWMIGDKCNLGTNTCGITSTIADVQSPALIGNNWEYIKNGQWIEAQPGDISVINIKGRHKIA